jgi:hypothetical protein
VSVIGIATRLAMTSSESLLQRQGIIATSM